MFSPAVDNTFCMLSLTLSMKSIVILGLKEIMDTDGMIMNF